MSHQDLKSSKIRANTYKVTQATNRLVRDRLQHTSSMGLGTLLAAMHVCGYCCFWCPIVYKFDYCQRRARRVPEPRYIVPQPHRNNYARPGSRYAVATRQFEHVHGRITGYPLEFRIVRMLRGLSHVFAVFGVLLPVCFVRTH